ncbi:hypothetical protein ES703_77622 [subsurface metagenome]
MKDYATIFKAFVCPYLAVYFGSCIGFLFVTGQDIPQLLWVLFVGALSEMGIEFGALPLVKKIKKKT